VARRRPHFPEEDALFSACTSHWASLHPFPSTEPWAAEVDPLQRLARALRDVWAWYAGVESDLELIIRDADLAHELATAIDGSGVVRAAVGHALAFETWRSLVRREGLTTDASVAAMLTLVDQLRSAQPA